MHLKSADASHEKKQQLIGFLLESYLKKYHLLLKILKNEDRVYRK